MVTGSHELPEGKMTPEEREELKDEFYDEFRAEHRQFPFPIPGGVQSEPINAWIGAIEQLMAGLIAELHNIGHDPQRHLAVSESNSLRLRPNALQVQRNALSRIRVILKYSHGITLD